MDWSHVSIGDLNEKLIILWTSPIFLDGITWASQVIPVDKSWIISLEGTGRLNR